MTALKRDQPETCLSDLVLDELAAGELETVAAAHAAEHLASCARWRAHKLELEQERAAFYESAPTLTPRVVPLRRSARTRATVWATSALMVAAAAAALLVRLPDDTLGIRTKGTPTLGFFVKREGRVLPGHDGETVYPGDQLRFSTSGAGGQFVAVLSLDGAGTASTYYPAASLAAKALAGANVPLDSAVQLDGVLGREQVLAVFCPSAFAVEPLRLALAARGAVVAPAGCTTHRLVLNKAVKP